MLPMADHDTTCPIPAISTRFSGSIALFDNLIAEAHARDIRVTMDLVPNHTSDQHEWFRAALAAGPGSPERARYIFRDGRGEGGDEPPNNWLSVFGGPTCHRVTEADGSPGQWYMHLRPRTARPELGESGGFRRPGRPCVLARPRRRRFPDRRGARHGQARDLPDMDLDATRLLENNDDDPRFNNYAVHAIHRKDPPGDGRLSGCGQRG